MVEPNSTSQRPSVKGDDASPGKSRHPATPSAGTSGSLLFAIIATLALLAIAAVFALRQSPHPDMSRSVAAWNVTDLDWWAWPLERNAFKRNIIRGNLRAIDGVPATRLLWAVGESGLILHSTDAGAIHRTRETDCGALIRACLPRLQKQGPQIAALVFCAC
jgi:hypothetical protein